MPNKTRDGMPPPPSPSMGVTSSSLRFSVSSTASSSTQTTPTLTPKPLPKPVSPPAPAPGRPRGQSTSVIRPPPSSSLATPLSRVTSEPNVPLAYSDSQEEHEQNAFSVFGITLGSRKRMDSMEGSLMGSTTPPNAPPSSWWGGSGHDLEVAHRPWRDPPRRKKTVPEEQTEGYVHTRERVAQAVASILGTAGDAAHEVLLTSVDLLDLAPVPGLASAARVLLNIWDALELVDTNRLACLRLTERCAEILISVREEIKETGDSVDEELAAPVAKLEESFVKVQMFLQKQVHRPFLKRYLKRDEILAQIRECDASLVEALSRFSMSIQIRILKQVQASERRREADTRLLMQTLRDRSSSASPSPIPSEVQETPKPQSKPTLEPPGSPSALPPSQILPTLKTIHSNQNTLDAAGDSADLRALMRAALQTSSDVEMLGVLQIGREEMPEAIKTLQRALERVGENEQEQAVEGFEVVDKGKGKGILQRKRTKPVRSKTGGSAMTASTGASGSSGTSRSDSDDGRGRDTLDREFIESGIDALRRMSRGVETNLPSWTITRYEVDREQKIGIGFFSDVYRGTWRGRTVAIKVLAPSTPRELFVREVGIWKGLRHENVLELYGASSASGERPWFFVSPYMRNGSLVEFLKRVAVEGEDRRRSSMMPPAKSSPRGRNTSLPMRIREKSRSPGGTKRKDAEAVVPREGDLFRFMLEIAKGMDYLHRNGVLHGDLKAANVLVSDDIRCVISDFGQSEMKSEAYRISGTTPPHGTLRWQAPELMSGLQHAFTPQMDVYAYAISCVEILSMGRLPWALMDDGAVRHFVLQKNERPAIPNTRFNTPLLQDLLRVCWHKDPTVRPSFAKIVVDVKAVRKAFLREGGNGDEIEVASPITIERDRMWDWNWDQTRSRESPDMRPLPLPSSNTPPKFGTPPGPGAAGPLLGISPDSSATESTFLTAEEDLSSSSATVRPPVKAPPSISPLDTGPHREETVANADIRMPEPVIFTATAPSTRASSLFASTPSSQSLEDLGLKALPDFGGYESPAPQDERIAQMRDERRYRLLLSHEFHPSLTLPMWSPSPVALGAVGYLSKPAGAFVTLFGAFHPEKSQEPATRELPSLYGYGRVTTGGQRQDKRNAAQRGLDAVVGLLTSMGRSGPVSQSVSRRYSFPLRAGHKTAHMCTETTMYRYVESLDVPKRWFKANVDAILHIYGPTHHVQREDLYLVIGTLDAPDYALFVSHNHPDGQAHFNVFSHPRTGQPWGTFTTDTAVPPELGGPSYDEPLPENPLSTCKVSNTGGPWDTVLIARLRFKPDAVEPTSL
ncbi:putative protein tyrosine kinase [Lyophyllum shimeji]|uniref:Protein kinase domain-containing protein n=1 Tax=Lyophyllum shimeji TaxID=47721 RepID=A0A9P3PZ51_LYOSH|nr:putative protein tyrosine kinase [Lyophyllum shimeji]